MEISVTSKFVRQYKKLSKEVQLLAKKRERIFRRNPFDPRLKAHKLGGHLVGFYSFSVNFAYRIIFDLPNENTARFYEIGTHDIYE